MDASHDRAAAQERAANKRQAIERELAALTDAAETLCTFLLKHHLTAAGSDACVAVLGRIEASHEVLDA